MTAPAPTLAELAGAQRLLVIADYDGVLAPIVGDPAAAHPDPAAKDALLRLARLPRTHVAVLSGRSLESVTGLLGAAPGVTIIGSHGAEAGDALVLNAEQRTRLAEAVGVLEDLAATTPGSLIEQKPASVALHVRNAEPAAGSELVAQVRRGPAAWPGIRSVEGKQVIELLVTASHKGAAVDGLRRRFEPVRIVVLGDDVTDEDAFAALGDDDLGIKVGVGETRAAGRVDSQPEVAALLAELAERRSREVGPGNGGGESSR